MDTGTIRARILEILEIIISNREVMLDYEATLFAKRSLFYDIRQDAHYILQSNSLQYDTILCVTELKSILQQFRIEMPDGHPVKYVSEIPKMTCKVVDAP